MKRFNRVLHTKGDGYWSTVSKPVKVTQLNLSYVNEENTFGELRAYFDTATWNVPKDGLIYTDSQFLDELLDQLFLAGFDVRGVDYSEQGMQGDHFVSLDVGEKFIRSWLDAA